jgi:hypothetical protein
VADGVGVEARGKPVVTIVGREFLRGAEMKRRALGLPSLPLAVIAIPGSAEAARAQAAAIADAVAAVLAGPPELRSAR